VANIPSSTVEIARYVGKDDAIPLLTAYNLAVIWLQQGEIWKRSGVETL
jgi:hypothetical protein